MSKRGKGWRIWLVCLTCVCVFSLAASFLIKTERVYAESNRYDVVVSNKKISTGVTETKYITNEKQTNNDQVIAYAVKVDLSDNKNTLIAGYDNYDTSGNWGLSTVRQQVKDAESKRRVKVVAAVNGDFFNMGTGEPSGALVMNGKLVHKTNGGNYFAILKDGTAVIGSGNLPEGVQEAIGGSTIIVENGQISPSISGNYETTKQPRTAVGIDADGKVIIMVADGRQTPYSSGYSLYDLAVKMQEAGCVVAMNLDGGGSTTYLAKYEGSDDITLANSPSDGQERSVSSSLMVVSYAEATGVFEAAVISPDQEVFTPGSDVDVSAIGADTAGFACNIPEDADWRLALDTEVQGTFKSRVYDGGAVSAVFAADAGQTGAAKLQLVVAGKVVGQSEIDFQNPTSFTVKNSVVSLDFSERTDFGLEGHWNARQVHLKVGDIQWDIGETGSEKYPIIGTMDGNTFVAHESATNVSALVKASLKANPTVSIEISVSVGQLPTVAWDFEDVEQPDGTVIKAEDYYMIGADGFFDITYSKDGIGGGAKIVDSSTGEVRVGKKALQLSYDFTQTTPTAGVYFGPREKVNIPGHPTGLGVWVYIPEGTPNFWFRSYIYGLNEDGTTAPGNVAWGEPAYVCNFNEQGEDPYNEGWHYFEAKFDDFKAPAYTYVLKSQTFRIMYVNGSGSNSAGFIYLDNFQFVYGANTDDLKAPIIDSVMIGGDTVLIDGMTISNDPFTISAQYRDYDEPYSTGINSENVHVFIDGREIPLVLANDMELITNNISLPDGRHTIRVDVYDNFQNLSSKTYGIIVKNNKNYDKIYLNPSSDEAILGTDFRLEVFATNASLVETVSFDLKLAAGFTLSGVECADGFSADFDIAHVNNNIYRITINSNNTQLTYDALNARIATVLINCPVSLIEGSVLSYNVITSEVVFKDGYQSDIQNSFMTEENKVEVQGRYDFIVETMIVGSQDGSITVIDTAIKQPAVDVDVYIDGVLAGTTDENGKFITDAFVGEACVKEIYADDRDGGVSFKKRVYGVLAGGATDSQGNPSATPVYVRNVATVDGNAEQRIVWMSNPLAAQKNAFVEFATAKDYELNGPAALHRVEGDCVILSIDGNGNVAENFAVFVNQVLIEGLDENTEYVYRVGDGNVWSEIKDFSTSKDSGETNFVVIGDTQADEPQIFNAIGTSIQQSGINYNFALQTGDFVDSGSRYTLWSNILGVFSQYFSDIDFAHVFGNHEYEGDVAGENASTIHFTPSTDYYSYTYGNVYVAVINSYSRDGLEEAIQWVKQDAKQSTAVWKVLSMHRPAYFTNTSGGSDMANEMIPPLVDEVGFDVVFAGHDHTFARTQPMTGGKVSAEGAVYYIVGAAEEGGKYEITDNPEFNFAKVSGDFKAMYLSVNATDTTMTITAYNMKADGSFEVFDKYAISNSCRETGHDYVYGDGKLLCRSCNYRVAPDEIGFSGMIKNTSGQNVMFTQGELVSGWIYYLDREYYFDENGVGANGAMTVKNRYGELFGFVFDDGMVVGGDTGWCDNKTRYYIDGIMHQGWYEIDGVIYYFATGNEVGAEAKDKIGQKLTNGSYYIRTPTVPYMTNYYISFDKQGKVARDNFHEFPWGWVHTAVRKPTNEDDLWIVHCKNQWIDTEYGKFYAKSDASLATGVYVVDGVRYLFSAEGASPKDGLAKLLGESIKVSFNVDGKNVANVDIAKGTAAKLPETPSKQGNSVKSYAFDGWYSGNTKYTSDMVLAEDTVLEAKFIVVYTQRFKDLKNSIDSLREVMSGTLDEQYTVLNRVYGIIRDMSAAEIVDAMYEGVDVELYNTARKEYDNAIAGGNEDIDSAVGVSNAFLSVLQASALLAALGLIVALRRI